MEYRQTAPDCIAVGCTSISALKDVATGRFFTISACLCAGCYEKARAGEHIEIDVSRLIVEQRDRDGGKR